MSLPTITGEFGWPFKLNVQRTKLTEDQFTLLCQENPELRLELTAQGELIIMPPTGSEGGWRSGRTFYSLTAWTDQDGTGLSFDSSSGFTLPNGAIRSPDNGARLGWLIDPFDKRVYVYRPDQSPEILDGPAELRGDPVLPGFVLPVRELW